MGWKFLHWTRFTPTCVGKTRASWYRATLSPVHPHVRGEDFDADVCRRPVAGSPPRAWGRRTILADACLHVSVHPHVRGEDAWRESALESVTGSPPRAWGRRVAGERVRIRYRFTPTCVGKTRLRTNEDVRVTVHPHVRGEDWSSVFDWNQYLGSPPRAWGRPDGPALHAAGGRFTPTCVGKTAP